MEKNRRAAESAVRNTRLQGDQGLKLYHFTSVRHAKEILRSGVIRTTYSDIQPDGSGPAVVWLTSNPKPKQEWARSEVPNFLFAKYGIRITVDIPEKEAHRYSEWSRKMGIAPKWFKFYTERDIDFGSWYVVTRAIGRPEWRDVEMWEGFQSDQTQEYSRTMYDSFNSFLLGSEVQAWILESMNRDIEEGEGAPPVPVEEWMKMKDVRKQGVSMTEKFLGDIRGGNRKNK